MTKILLCGLCPLPFENTLRNFGPGIRTWQFAHSLAAAGHRVHLRAMMIPGSYEANEAIPRETRDGVEIERVDDKSFCDVDQLRVRIDEFQPDALVGATIYGSNVLALSRPEVPFWADQFGHVMAEAQAKAMLEGENWPIEHFWSLLEPVLLRADKFSGVSRRQRYATIGELGVVGRLSHETCGYEFSTVIPCALTPADSAPPRPLLRGSLIPDDAFIVLWSGGYNVWSDTDTLFEGLEKAFARADNIHFVSTGGSIDGHDERTYPRFQERIARSRYRDRFHLQGWVRAELVPSFQAEANLGVLTEVQIYEGLLGHKNRIVQWMGAGLPLAYNRMGDLGALLAEEQLGLTFEIGDSTALAEQILWASRHPDALADMRRRALEYTTEELSFAATTRELVAWAEHPSLAPDAKSRAPSAAAVGSWQPSNPAVETTSEPPEVERERVHAVIVHHRGEAMLARCLESLMASIRVELEVVVVANHCQEPLPELAHTSPQVHVVTSETSLGFSAANNLGVAWAKQHLGQPEFYYFVNNDTESTEDALVRLIAALEARPEAAMAGPKLLILDADDHYNSLGINVTEDGWGWDEGIGIAVRDYGPPPPLRPVLTVTGSALLIDAPVFDKVGGWTEIYEYYFEDIDLGLKVWKTDRQVIHVPDAVVRHQISATMTDGSSRKDFLFWRNRLFLAVVHWPTDLLWQTFRRARAEMREPQRENRPVLRQAMRETLQHLPALLRCRWRWRGNSRWRSFLVPPGSVPVITLPQAKGQAVNGADPATVDSTAEDSSSGPPGSSGAAPSTTAGATSAEDTALAQDLAEARAELAEARQHADHLEASYHEAQQVLNEIHGSKMWRLWTRYGATRQWLRRPFSPARRSRTSRG